MIKIGVHLRKLSHN